MLFWPNLGHFWCPVVTLVNFSSYLNNIEKKIQKITTTKKTENPKKIQKITKKNPENQKKIQKKNKN